MQISKNNYRMARTKKTFEVPKKQNNQRMYMLIPYPFNHYTALK